MAIALVLVVPRRHRWAAVILGAAYAIAISVTVIVLGWHYPSDVLAGTLVATGFGFLALAALRAGGYRAPDPSIEPARREPSPVLEVCLALAGAALSVVVISRPAHCSTTRASTPARPSSPSVSPGSAQRC